MALDKSSFSFSFFFCVRACACMWGFLLENHASSENGQYSKPPIFSTFSQQQKQPHEEKMWIKWRQRILFTVQICTLDSFFHIQTDLLRLTPQQIEDHDNVDGAEKGRRKTVPSGFYFQFPGCNALINPHKTFILNTSKYNQKNHHFL